MIRAIELTKRYGSTVALDRLSLEVPDGTVFGLLGPGGAGKTTFLRLVMGFVFPQAGQIDRGGLSPAQIGYLPEQASYPPHLSVRAYLTLVARLAGLRGAGLRQAVDRLTGEWGLESVAGRRLGACSQAMLRRLGLAQALVGDPPLLLLDEPGQGLDPTDQRFIAERIVALQQAGKTVLLGSHHLDEVTRVCSHIAVLKQGRLVRCGPLEEILAPHPQVTIVTGPLPDGLRDRLVGRSPDLIVAEGRLTLRGEAISYKAHLLRLLLDAGVDIRQIGEQPATLEDLFLEATGR